MLITDFEDAPGKVITTGNSAYKLNVSLGGYFQLNAILQRGLSLQAKKCPV